MLTFIHNAIAEIAPIEAVRLTGGEYVIEFSASATEQQQADAQAALSGIIADAQNADAVAEIKGRASRDIYLMAPNWKQRNALARTLELVESLARGNTLTADEETELATYRALWNQIKQRREQSDAEEAAL